MYPTFSEIAEVALVYNRTKWKGSRTEEQRRGLLKKYLNPVLGDIAIDQITSEQVMEALRPIWNVKVSTAKKVWQTLQSTVNYAIGMNYVVVDPLSKVKIGLGRQSAVSEHHEALPYDRIGEVWRALQAVRTSSASLVLELIILTGVRSSEARGARWPEINMAEATWTIPAERMKGGREHRVPLSAAAMDVIRRAKAAHTTSPILEWDLIFPNGNGHEVAKEKLPGPRNLQQACAWRNAQSSQEIPVEARRVVEIQVSANAGHCAVGGSTNLRAGEDKLSFAARVDGRRNQQGQSPPVWDVLHKGAGDAPPRPVPVCRPIVPIGEYADPQASLCRVCLAAPDTVEFAYTESSVATAPQELLQPTGECAGQPVLRVRDRFEPQERSQSLGFLWVAAEALKDASYIAVSSKSHRRCSTPSITSTVGCSRSVPCFTRSNGSG